MPRRRTRRSLLAAAALAAAGAGLGARGAVTAGPRSGQGNRGADAAGDDTEPFWDTHQGGITTRPQAHTYAAAFDLVTDKRDALVAMLRAWTAAAASMSGALPAPPGQDAGGPVADSGEALGQAAARLTVTFGFGAGLFSKNGIDRYGLAAQLPPALVDLPVFNGDELVEARSGGDLSVQSCADDPQTAFHAVRQLARIAHGVADLRWAQTGFRANTGPQETPRNLMGFKDGTDNPSVDDPAAMARVVWVGAEGPEWMRGGSYVVLRRIRIALEHWDRMPLDFQEQAVGRRKQSGAPLGGNGEFDPPDLAALDKDGDPVIPESAHVRLAAAASNEGAQILRRPYSYNDGVSLITERWSPWRRGMAYDAGLFFVCYQRDPRTGFIKIFDKLAQFDMLNQFVTHTGGGLFACPGGIARGEFIGQLLFEASARR